MGKEGLLPLRSTCVWRKTPVPNKPEQPSGMNGPCLDGLGEGFCYFEQLVCSTLEILLCLTDVVSKSTAVVLVFEKYFFSQSPVVTWLLLVRQ